MVNIYTSLCISHKTGYTRNFKHLLIFQTWILVGFLYLQAEFTDKLYIVSVASYLYIVNTRILRTEIYIHFPVCQNNMVLPVHTVINFCLHCLYKCFPIVLHCALHKSSKCAALHCSSLCIRTTSCYQRLTMQYNADTKQCYVMYYFSHHVPH